MNVQRGSFLPRRVNLSELVCHWEDADAAQSHPALYQLLSQAKVEGKYRAGSRLTLFCDDQRLKASIFDPDTQQVWFGTLDGLRNALETIEELLQGGKGEWRKCRDRK